MGKELRTDVFIANDMFPHVSSLWTLCLGSLTKIRESHPQALVFFKRLCMECSFELPYKILGIYWGMFIQSYGTIEETLRTFMHTIFIISLIIHSRDIFINIPGYAWCVVSGVQYTRFTLMSTMVLMYAHSCVMRAKPTPLEFSSNP